MKYAAPALSPVHFLRTPTSTISPSTPTPPRSALIWTYRPSPSVVHRGVRSIDSSINFMRKLNECLAIGSHFFGGEIVARVEGEDHADATAGGRTGHARRLGHFVVGGFHDNAF